MRETDNNLPRINKKCLLFNIHIIFFHNEGHFCTFNDRFSVCNQHRSSQIRKQFTLISFFNQMGIIDPCNG